MNQTQRKYALTRLGGVFQRRQNELRQKFTSKVYTGEEFVSDIKSGKLKMKSDLQGLSLYSRISDFYDLTGKDMYGTFDQTGFNKELRKLEQEFNKAQDEVMLGDEKEAMKLIQSFDK